MVLWGGQGQLRGARPSWAGLSGCHQVSWAQARLSADMPSETPLPSPSAHPPGWLGPKPHRSRIFQSEHDYPGVPPRGPLPLGWHLGVAAKATSQPGSIALSGTTGLGRKARLWLDWGRGGPGAQMCHAGRACTSRGRGSGPEGKGLASPAACHWQNWAGLPSLLF